MMEKWRMLADTSTWISLELPGSLVQFTGGHYKCYDQYFVDPIVAIEPPKRCCTFLTCCMTMKPWQLPNGAFLVGTCSWISLCRIWYMKLRCVQSLLTAIVGIIILEKWRCKNTSWWLRGNTLLLSLKNLETLIIYAVLLLLQQTPCVNFTQWSYIQICRHEGQFSHS